MESPTATGEYFSDSCGDLYTYYLKVGRGGVIEDISYFTTGCGFGTATCSLLVDLARGKTVDEAYAISEAQIEAELDGYPEKKKDYPERSLLALRAAIDDYRAKRASGAISDAMLESASNGVTLATMRGVAPTHNGKTSQDEEAAPKIGDEGEKLVIKLH